MDLPERAGAPLTEAAPPPAPRPIPNEVLWRLLVARNPLSLLGFVFTFPLACTCCFPVAGVPMLAVGLAGGLTRVKVLRDGEAVDGRVTGVSLDETQTVGDRHPWRVEYTYVVGGVGHTGSWRTWDPRASGLSPGDRVAVLCLGDQSALWPPMT